MNWMSYEHIALWLALVGYTLACVLAEISLVFDKRHERKMAWIMGICVGLHTFALVARWVRLGHLPVGNGFEMLSANIWGLMLAAWIAYLALPKLRVFAALTLPVVMLLMAWMLLIPKAESTLPPSYDTAWLFIHIGFIKLFLGSAFVALGLSAALLLRSGGLPFHPLRRLPEDIRLDELSFRFMALALIFDSLGITAGAIWAMDAWGRYWSWDTLEVWSLITWLSIGASLHLRASFRTRPTTNAWMVLGVFIVAFFTFFGIPFVSTALHKGAI